MSQEPKRPQDASKSPSWQEIDAEFDRLLDLSAEERNTRLAELKSENTALAREVESLLAHTDPDSDRLDSGISGSVDHLVQGLQRDIVAEREQGHRRVGAYELIDRLAVGGMGRVYRARRVDGQYEQDVAVKLLRWELVDPSSHARFTQERQILATLNHPAIARLLDGGVAEDGIPYLVMELVDGEPIDQFCDEHALDARAIVRLVLTVVDAVADAHRQLIVHRDIKPSNVIVDHEERPKLLDFGVAKPLDATRSAGQDLTGTGTGPYTFAYASPEQLLGRPVDTASDLYSLGALLYRLLTGTTPFDSIGAGQADPRLRGEVAVAPSKRSQCQEQGKPRGQRTPAAADLDAIVLKCLSHEPDRRYGSAEALRLDLENWLDGNPVAAIAPSALYRASKFVRRHTVAVGLVALVFLSVIAGALIAWRQAVAAERERQRATTLADFSTDLLRFADPNLEGSGQLSARRWLESGARQAESIDDRQVRAQILAVIGEGLGNLSVHDEAETLLLKAAQDLGYPEARTPDIARLLRLAAENTAADERLDEAIPMVETALAIFEETLGEDDPDVATTYTTKAFLLLRYLPETDRRRSEADALLERAIQLQRAGSPDGSEALASSLHLRGQQRLAEARFVENGPGEALQTEALAQMNEAAEMRRRLGGPDGRAMIESLNDLGLAYDNLDQGDRAIELLHEAMEVGEQRLEPSHPTLLQVRNNLAAVYRAAGRYEEAEVLYRQIVAAWESAGLEAPIQPIYGLTKILLLRGQTAEAAKLLAGVAPRLSPESVAYWYFEVLRGEAARQAGDRREARRILEQAVERSEALLAPESDLLLYARERLAAASQ